MKKFEFPVYIISRGYGTKIVSARLSQEAITPENPNTEYCDKITSANRLNNWLKEYSNVPKDDYAEAKRLLLNGDTIKWEPSTYTSI